MARQPSAAAPWFIQAHTRCCTPSDYPSKHMAPRMPTPHLSAFSLKPRTSIITTLRAAGVQDASMWLHAGEVWC